MSFFIFAGIPEPTQEQYTASIAAEAVEILEDHLLFPGGYLLPLSARQRCAGHGGSPLVVPFRRRILSQPACQLFISPVLRATRCPVGFSKCAPHAFRGSDDGDGRARIGYLHGRGRISPELPQANHSKCYRLRLTATKIARCDPGFAPPTWICRSRSSGFCSNRRWDGWLAQDVCARQGIHAGRRARSSDRRRRHAAAVCGAICRSGPSRGATGGGVSGHSFIHAAGRWTLRLLQLFWPDPEPRVAFQRQVQAWKSSEVEGLDILRQGLLLAVQEYSLPYVRRTILEFVLPGGEGLAWWEGLTGLCAGFGLRVLYLNRAEIEAFACWVLDPNLEYDFI